MLSKSNLLTGLALLASGAAAFWGVRTVVVSLDDSSASQKGQPVVGIGAAPSLSPPVTPVRDDGESPAESTERNEAGGGASEAPAPEASEPEEAPPPAEDPPPGKGGAPPGGGSADSGQPPPGTGTGGSKGGAWEIEETVGG